MPRERLRETPEVHVAGICFTEDHGGAIQLLYSGVRFLCRRVGRGEPSSRNHSELRWMGEEEFAATPAAEFIDGLKAEVLELLVRYRQSRPQR
ncbi:hypothetical protein ACN27F_04070 [Solwaraspora sp. WMMB335]|uniref:hypothetical protein n=1 Tax=Solwaraspora sp. WMMB335 TaxID=3404118 RepID=UPI003B93B17C